jgi:hypothetical protein
VLFKSVFGLKKIKLMLFLVLSDGFEVLMSKIKNKYEKKLF